VRFPLTVSLLFLFSFLSSCPAHFIFENEMGWA